MEQIAFIQKPDRREIREREREKDRGREIGNKKYKGR